MSMASTAKKRRKRDLDLGIPINTPAVAPANTLVAPANTAVAPAKENLGWWNEYSAENIVALDCEMVSLKQKDEFGHHIQQAATVSIVNLEDEIVYEVHLCNEM
jgi:hypothetical protein